MQFATKQCYRPLVNQGFTLVEVLVAMLILSVGILGLAALETLTLKNNQSAYHRSQATILTYDLADKMRANMVVDYWDVTASSHAGSCVSYTSTVSPCGAQELAEKELYGWETSIADILPSGLGAVSVSGAITTITIQWDDDRDGDVDGDDGVFEVDLQL